MSLLELQKLLKSKDVKIRELQLLLSKRESFIEDLKSKLDQFQSILPMTVITKKEDVKAHTDEFSSKKRGFGISAEPNSEAFLDMSKKRYLTFPKVKKLETLIFNAINQNDFMKHIKVSQINNIVACMKRLDFKKDVNIIKEGDEGSMVYVLEDGSVQVFRNGVHLKNMGSGQVFGELAILYNCTRTASIKTITKCTVWAIDRETFQSIMMYSEICKQNEYVRTLKQISFFSKYKMSIITALVDSVKEKMFHQNTAIIKQGTYGDSFFILLSGTVRVTRNSRNSKNDIEMEIIKAPAVFGTQILVDNEIQPFNCIAHSSTVVCLILDIESYNSTIKEKRSTLSVPTVVEKHEIDVEFQNITLNDVQVVGTLGIGGFGRVELVVLQENESKTYALKCLNKQNIVRLKQEKHLINEKTITMNCDCPFIIRTYRTFKDSRFLYILSEACLGGELWTILRDRRCFSESESKFFVGSIAEAFRYLHGNKIVYRDLKPENILLDHRGYVKMVISIFCVMFQYLFQFRLYCLLFFYFHFHIILLFLVIHQFF
ncbi:hypothetical protein A3Q56_05926 [Intoshia linei]|uniref:cGMP-dependent protein kinase n=1 Tax=Intoshia linei TaxID=1819745 RepID=A0A177AXX4_9BILA|nr:hypothetical protein A3Q56_05926 [Intoshia linei]